MYGNMYERERARARGEASGDYTYQASVLRERLKSKDLTPSERIRLRHAERDLIKQAQKVELKSAVNQGANRIEAHLTNKMRNIQKKYAEVQEELHILQRQLKDAFDSMTGDAVQEWLVTTHARDIEQSQEDLYRVW
ncbi:hypothetical protein MFLO_09537 [Listeria floridensis FSL S10-1187]|uniref:Uncharacterized protein n=1 Tax=Listeria floridensis FSL S10-1187 TaxID=1265817 RepID=A0ABP3AXE5_9LIST|nr:hypothetical protein [Listeria floridensis]EUJ31280.1 hypothetical protein MFLO_09537 [Listeria floridensis FSL S10-1187]